MTRDRWSILAAQLLLGCLVFALSAPSRADEKKEVKDVKFACSQHGPEDMMLTLSLEKGASRKIEFLGGSSAAKWLVKIDGVDTMVPNNTTFKVRPEDAITWSVTAGKHGVAFAEQDLAQAMLDFDMTVGQKLDDQTMKLKTPAWKAFGTKRWGTDPTTTVGLLASAKVKK